MKLILLCGEIKDEFDEIFINTFNNYSNIITSDDINLFNINDKSKDFFILSCKEPINTNSDNGIIIFKNNFIAKDKNYDIKNFITITNSDNKQAFNVIKKNKLTTITCGTSPKETMSIASVNNKNIVVSLQRNLTTLDSKIIESRDFIIKLKQKTDFYTIEATCLALILSDIKCENNEFYKI